MSTSQALIATQRFGLGSRRGDLANLARELARVVFPGSDAVVPTRDLIRT